MIRHLSKFAYNYPIIYYITGTLLFNIIIPQSSSTHPGTYRIFVSWIYTILDQLIMEIIIWPFIPRNHDHMEVIPVSATWSLLTTIRTYGLNWKILSSTFMLRSVSRIIRIKYGLSTLILWIIFLGSPVLRLYFYW